MNNVKFYKKGEVLFKDGEKGQNIFIIQSGAVSVYTQHKDTRKIIEVFRANMGQVIGEEILGGALSYNNTAVAANDSNVIEFPAAQIKTQIENLPQIVKLLVKSLNDRVKLFGSDVKNYKVEKGEEMPCPPENVAKVFAIIFYVAGYSGVKKDGKISIKWPVFKKYCQRVFLESPIRLEQAFYVLVKLKIAELQMVKNETDPDGPDELGFFHLKETEMKNIEKFFDLVQHYQFKAGGPGQILKYDEKVYQFAATLIKLSENERIDQKGVVYMNYKDTLDKLKEIIGPTFTPDSFTRLEQKGLFVKRDPSEKGGTLSFYKTEFQDMLQCWLVLKEIEKWNEKGSVDLNENKPKVVTAQTQVEIITCTQCMSQITPEMKFCSACGFKLK